MPNTPCPPFVLRFVQESSDIEDVSMPDDAYQAAWRQRSGHLGAARHALELAEAGEPLSIQHLCAWQAAITREQLPYGHWIAEQHIGCLRTQRMRMGKRRFADPEDIRPALDEILSQINAARPEDALETAARAHWRFELVHPFADGNGRTGRLLVLYALRAARVPPVLFTAGDRNACYYRCFDPAGPDAMMAYFHAHQLEAIRGPINPATPSSKPGDSSSAAR